MNDQLSFLPVPFLYNYRFHSFFVCAGVWKWWSNCRTFQPIFNTPVLLPHTMYTAQFQFTRHSLDLSDNVCMIGCFHTSVCMSKINPLLCYWVAVYSDMYQSYDFKQYTIFITYNKVIISWFWAHCECEQTLTWCIMLYHTKSIHIHGWGNMYHHRHYSTYSNIVLNMWTHL